MELRSKDYEAAGMAMRNCKKDHHSTARVIGALMKYIKNPNVIKRHTKSIQDAFKLAFKKPLDEVNIRYNKLCVHAVQQGSSVDFYFCYCNIVYLIMTDGEMGISYHIPLEKTKVCLRGDELEFY